MRIPTFDTRVGRLGAGLGLCVGLVAIAAIAALGSCADASPPSLVRNEGRLVRPLAIVTDQAEVVRSSILRLRLRGTQRLVADAALVVIQGTTHYGERVNETFALLPKREGDVGELYVEIPVASSLWPLVRPNPNGSFQGSVRVDLSDSLGLLAQGSIENLALQFTGEFIPRVEPPRVGDVYVAEQVALVGQNFLRPEEGTTWAVLDQGEVRVPGKNPRSLAGSRIAVAWSGSRTQAALPMDPAILGVQLGEFSARVRFVNELRTGEVFEGLGAMDLEGRIQQSYIAMLTPEAGSRGQKVRMIGRGFVPTQNDTSVSMLLRFDGILRPDDPASPTLDLRGARAVERIPDRVLSEDVIEQSVWYGVANRRLTGLGAMPGVFEGTITPVLVDRYGEQVGMPWPGSFRILPTKQLVYLKYLPAFSKGLEKYGLENVERDIRDRILEVVHRDYAGINIAFVEDSPQDFIDFATVEIGGPDPSGNQAFGYDNTFNDAAKDTGNLYLNDYLGGINAQSGEQFNNPFGGIFIESFAFFSPTLTPDNPFASPEFDRILRPFMPALGGVPVKGSEWPGGMRDGAIDEAIHMVGTVIANTVSHELGHSLGMTFYPEDWDVPGNTFHNRTPSGCIMDAGQDRTFEQRAELSGQPPARFNERNLNYLKAILPVQQ